MLGLALLHPGEWPTHAFRDGMVRMGSSSTDSSRGGKLRSCCVDEGQTFQTGVHSYKRIRRSDFSLMHAHLNQLRVGPSLHRK